MELIYEFWSILIRKLVFCFNPIPIYVICECFHFFRTKVENFFQFSNDNSLKILVISPYHISSTWHAKIPISVLFSHQWKSPGSKLLIFAPNFNSSCLTCKYQYLLASASPYTHFCNFHTLLVFASAGRCKYTILSVFLPCKDAVFTYSKLIFQFCEAISANIYLTHICEQHGESVGKSCNSWNPLVYILSSFSDIVSIDNLLLITHLTNMQGRPEWSSSK